MRRGTTICLGYVTGAAMMGSAAWGDFLITRPFQSYLIDRYSDAGQNLGLFASTGGESADGISVGPDGTVYVTTNTIGKGSVERYNAQTGVRIATYGSTQLEIPSDSVVVGTILYVPSDHFTSVGVRGILKYDLASNAYLGPFAAAAPQFAEVTHFNEATSAPGNRLAVSNDLSTWEYTLTAGGGVASRLPVGGGAHDLAYLPGSPTELYLTDANRTRIDHYSSASGQFVFVNTLIAQGGPGLNQGQDVISDFVFDGAGHLFLIDSTPVPPGVPAFTQRLLRYSASTGQFEGLVATLGTDSSNYADMAYLPVPEPGAGLLVVVAGVGMLLCRKRFH